MEARTVFQRNEIKYLITREQQKLILEKMCCRMKPDDYGKTTICNLYYDTGQFLLIRRSLEKPLYKEKLRLRSYGIARPDSRVFLEMKKKYDAVVYKRRLGLSEADATAYLNGEHALPLQSQIADELDYFCRFYETLRPTVFLSYERQAFYGREDRDLRVTFDENILWRNDHLSLCEGIFGQPLLSRDQVLMEIKTAGAVPLWLTRCLSENRIYKISFSKYGAAYQALLQKSATGGFLYA